MIKSSQIEDKATPTENALAQIICELTNETTTVTSQQTRKRVEAHTPKQASPRR